MAGLELKTLVALFILCGALHVGESAMMCARAASIVV